MWALGCVLYELAALRRPFTGHSVSAIAVKILRGQYAPLPEHYSPQLQQLVGLLLSRKVDRRPTVEQVRRHPKGALTYFIKILYWWRQAERTGER